MTWHVAEVLLGKAALLFAVAGVFALAWLLPHRGFHLLRKPAARALDHPRLAGVRRRAPGLVAFADRHLRGDRRSWFRVAVGALVVVCGLFWFDRLLHGVLSDGALVVADHRLHNTVGRFHSTAMWRFYSLASHLGSSLFAAPLVAGLAALFWAAGRRRESLGVVLSLAGAIIFSSTLQSIIERPRPAEAQALFHGSSFPSGHTLAGASVYGFLVYLLLRDEPRRAWRRLLAIPLLFLIGAIPLSRIYLGVHWPYDTVASLALAAAWLAVLISLFKFAPLDRRLPAPKQPCGWLPGALAAFVTAMAAYAALLAVYLPQRKVAPPPKPTREVAPGEVLGAYPTGMPKSSEDAIGGPMEPVSLIYMGNAADLIAAFRRAGWQLAETTSVHGVARELWAVVRDRPDPNGPATPAYLGGEPQDLTFEKPGDPSGSIRRRHHTRLWRTALCVAPRCLPLWMATASYDAGIKMVREPYLLTHRVDSRVDLERDLIAHDLLQAGARELAVLNVTGPTRGRNAGGDGYLSDGRAYVFAVP